MEDDLRWKMSLGTRLLQWKMSLVEDLIVLYNVESLKSRRYKISLTFALKCTKNEKLKHIFELNTGNTHTKYLTTHSDIRAHEKFHSLSNTKFKI